MENIEYVRDVQPVHLPSVLADLGMGDVVSGTRLERGAEVGGCVSEKGK